MKYSLIIQEGEENTIYLPPDISLSGQTMVAFGSMSTPCRFISSPLLDKQIIIANDVAKRLYIPFSADVHVFFDEDTVHLGPLVGIFTAGFTKSPLRPVRKRSFFFAKLLSQEKKVGVFAFVFGAHHINWEKGTITGYFYTDSGWTQHEVPFPAVIYNRLPNRRIENDETFQAIKETLKTAYGIPWFNENFFNKREVYRLLEKHPLSRPYLPDTSFSPTIETAGQFLNRYGEVYLKPANGSHGLGIHHILKKNTKYECRFRDKQGTNRSQSFPTLSSLWKNIFSQQKKLNSYIIQQGIRLIEINGRKVDFRVHTNKNEEGNWQVSAIAAKIAEKTSVTTHIHSGGTVKTIEEIFPDQSVRGHILRQLCDAALTLSRCLEEQLQMNIGEIGFDLGIDRQHRIWMFEANSKPGRSIFTHPKLKQYDELTAMLSLAYAVYLSKKTTDKREALFT
ncbi:YheC/YheD family protein [Parageobacillus thermoglucosidasius]|uniref:YheC/YheD family endospore coat-associated protein n=1 Tax=Parageobacillus thermoglucosidasius TaxID=1426 RepID=UPI000E141057|nr:YheC/YheD family protein [Parageobacillus thermoglucosidasius]MED4903024.1 YheC/YheD family protein [Parageobacillus thermoglucosidasius]MED4915183.1 YheC/YheD family protein [Parageobacillus thermoglucosidasius]MED4945928.1 YheC/YheD family protein [Parageobacillus thermoglucosidasius]MED4981704.1 YheC/YheD family protein [Parageobacillus thermoglucosidasius]RDE28799.1 YheC/YheD family protein [Parageobacillus thermoglucosidasius]